METAAAGRANSGREERETLAAAINEQRSLAAINSWASLLSPTLLLTTNRIVPRAPACGVRKVGLGGDAVFV